MLGIQRYVISSKTIRTIMLLKRALKLLKRLILTEEVINKA
jgi:hypothetical protein